MLASWGSISVLLRTESVTNQSLIRIFHFIEPIHSRHNQVSRGVKSFFGRLPEEVLYESYWGALSPGYWALVIDPASSRSRWKNVGILCGWRPYWWLSVEQYVSYRSLGRSWQSSMFIPIKIISPIGQWTTSLPVSTPPYPLQKPADCYCRNDAGTKNGRWWKVERICKLLHIHVCMFYVLFELLRWFLRREARTT